MQTTSNTKLIQLSAFFGHGFIRFNSTKTPRFLKTLSETSKPALTKPDVINKPFGLPVPILLNPKNNSRWSLKNEVFSAEAKEIRQRQLDHDITHSPFYESKSFTNTKGKIFTPPISYFKSDKALYFPNLYAKSLNNNEHELHSLFKGKTNLVRVFSTISGEQCTETYFKYSGKNYLSDDYPEFVEKYPNTQIIDINIPQGWLKNAILLISKRNIRKTLPKERHEYYFIIPDKLFSYDIKQELKCDNNPSGYIYLVDTEGKIRWATSGNATDSERELLDKCLKGVAKELN